VVFLFEELLQNSKSLKNSWYFGFTLWDLFGFEWCSGAGAREHTDGDCGGASVLEDIDILVWEILNFKKRDQQLL